MKLTVRRLDTLRPRPGRRVDYADDDVPGLALRVTPQGAKTWSLRYRIEGGRRGRMRRLTLGAYPSVTLVDARKAARKAIGKIAATGADPAAAKQAARLAATRTGDTVADLAKD